MSTIDPAHEMDLLRSLVATCAKCDLCKSRSMTVLGDGPVPAKVMLVGEAPGANEDKTGHPFVGAAGQNLDFLLEKSGFDRKDIYIANVLKCRPPRNADPTPFQIAACKDYLTQQVRFCDPVIIITMGNFATHFFLPDAPGISRARGKVTDIAFAGATRKILPIFHPAAAIYDKAKEPILVSDFQLAANLIAQVR